MKTFVSLITLALAVSAQAQLDLSIPDGSSGYKLLKLQPSPRAEALSGAGSAVSGLGSDQDQNPAVAKPDGNELSGGYASLPEKFATGIQHLSWRIPAGPGTFTGRIRYEGFSDLAGYDDEDQSTGDFSASTWTAGGGYAWNIDSSFTVGTRLQYAMNSVERYHSWAIVGDLGVRYAPVHHPWSLAASLLNVGKSSVADSVEDKLPTTVVLGAGWRFPRLSGWQFTLLADLRHPNDEAWTLPVGVEAQWSVLTVRAGFPVLADNARPSFGAGLAWENIRLDGSVAWNAVTGMTSALEFALAL